MVIISNQTPIDDVILGESILIVGDSGSGKSVLIKNLILEYAEAENKIGLIYGHEELFEYQSLMNQLAGKLQAYEMEKSNFNEIDIQAFIQQVDVLIIDEGAATIGDGENIIRLLELAHDKINIVSYQTINSISDSLLQFQASLRFQTLRVLFNKTVIFKSREEFNAQFLPEECLAAELADLPVGNAFVIPRSSIITGRQGSGKTTFLSYFNDIPEE